MWSPPWGRSGGFAGAAGRPVTARKRVFRGMSDSIGTQPLRNAKDEWRVGVGRLFDAWSSGAMSIPQVAAQLERAYAIYEPEKSHTTAWPGLPPISEFADPRVPSVIREGRSKRDPWTADKETRFIEASRLKFFEELELAKPFWYVDGGDVGTITFE